MDVGHYLVIGKGDFVRLEDFNKHVIHICYFHFNVRSKMICVFQLETIDTGLITNAIQTTKK